MFCLKIKKSLKLSIKLYFIIFSKINHAKRNVENINAFYLQTLLIVDVCDDELMKDCFNRMILTH